MAMTTSLIGGRKRLRASKSISLLPLLLFAFSCWSIAEGFPITTTTRRRRSTTSTISSIYYYRHRPHAGVWRQSQASLLFRYAKATDSDGKKKKKEKTIPLPENKDYDDYVDVDSVSEAEALLACRAYLQRRNRLGEWTAGERRKQLRKEARKQGNIFGEERHWYNNETDDFDTIMDFDSSDETTDDDGEEAEDDDDDDDDDKNNKLDDYFERDGSIWDTGPSPSRIRRSEAAKRKWDRPEYRAAWYKQRWEGRVNKKRSNKDKMLEEKIRALSPEAFLAKEEVVSMTEEEIAEAIRIYVISKRKRTATKKRQLAERRAKQSMFSDSDDDEEEEEEEEVSNDTSSEPDTETILQQRREARSENAKRIYQIRLENAKIRQQPKERATPVKKLPKTLAARSTPQDAIVRVIAQLDAQLRPDIADVELMLQTGRLANRKQVLCRILRDCFDLRGKCIPIDLTNNASECRFATTAPVEEVGAFVLLKLRQTEKVK